MTKKRQLLISMATVAGLVLALLRSATAYAGTIPELITDYNVQLADEEVAIMNPLSTNSCALIYVFDNAQNLQYCCGCPVSGNGLLDLSVGKDLLGLDDKNPSGIIEILPSQVPLSGKCDPTKPPAGAGAVLQAAEYQELFFNPINISNSPSVTFLPRGLGAVKTFFANVTVNSPDAGKVAKLCAGMESCTCGGGAPD